MSSKFSVESWALTRLEPLLPLPEESLKEVISYALSLTDANEVSSHFEGLLGSAEEVLNFISDFNSRLFPQRAMRAPTTAQPSSSASSSANAPPAKRRGRKGKPPINQYANQPRQVEGQFGNPAAVYMKKDIEDEYYTGGSRVSTAKPVESSSPSSSVPVSRTATPIPRSSTPQLVQQKTQQSSSNVGGKLTSDLINVKAKVKKAPQKIHVTGGVAMRGASAELTDLESALRALELSTNPTLTSKSQKCNCAGMKHEVLSAAPNCLSCGKIICIKEGLAPCSFCNTPLIAPDELQSMIRELREESGRERMAMNNAMQKRPDVARVPKPFSNHDSTPGTNDDEGLRKATEHRDRLLVFQATSAQRTKIIDQAADFETPVMGSNMWATPQERALQLKKQQKAMREMEWNAKEDYEKRRVVVAVDLKGRQVVRKMQEIERPREGSDEGDVEEEAYDDTLERGGATATNSTSKGGTYSRNPLLKGMIRPVYDSGKGKGKEGGEGEEGKKVDTEAEGYTGGSRGWRRVQDDFADNEEVILDGSMSAEGSGEKERGTQGEEPACG